MRAISRSSLFICLIFLMLGIGLFWFCYETDREASRHLTPAGVSVRGYYRRDGTYINSYNRRPPGGVVHDAPYERIQTFCIIGMIASFFIAIVTPSILLEARRRRSLQSKSLGRKGTIAYPHSYDSNRDKHTNTNTSAELGQNDIILDKLPKLDNSPNDSDSRFKHSTYSATVFSKLTALISQSSDVPDDVVSTTQDTLPSSVYTPALSCSVCNLALSRSTGKNKVVVLSEHIYIEDDTGSAYCMKCSESVKHCNCAACSGVLIASQIGGRILGRPYCHGCLESHSDTAGKSRYLPEDSSPFQANLIRCLEDGEPCL
ncbi:hypothetical protein BH11PLA2_BH11PLA2_01030 [soil metagenome]